MSKDDEDKKTSSYEQELEARLEGVVEFTAEGPKISDAYKEKLDARCFEIAAQTGLLPADIKEIAIMAISNNMVIGERPVNLMNQDLLARDDTMGKPMSTKGKSNPHTGFIHVDQVRESKITDPKVGEEFAEKVRQSIQNKEAVSVRLTTENEEPISSVTMDDGKTDYVYKSNETGTYFSAKTGDPIDITGKELRDTMVLADPTTHRKYVADYDPLLYAPKVMKEDKTPGSPGENDIAFPSFKPLEDKHYEGFYDTYKAMQARRNEEIENLRELAETNSFPELAKPLINKFLEISTSPEAVKFAEEQEMLRDFGGGLPMEEVDSRCRSFQDTFFEDQNRLGEVYEVIRQIKNQPQIPEEVTEQIDIVQRAIADAKDPGDIMKSVGVTSQEQEVIASALRTATNEATSHSAETANPVSFIAEIQENVRDGVFIAGPRGEISFIKEPDNVRSGEVRLAQVMNDYRDNGYAVVPNPRWGWEMEDNGRFSVPHDEYRMDYKKVETDIKSMVNIEQQEMARNIATLHYAIEECKYRDVLGSTRTFPPEMTFKSPPIPPKLNYVTSDTLEGAKLLVKEMEQSYKREYGTPSPLAKETERCATAKDNFKEANPTPKPKPRMRAAEPLRRGSFRKPVEASEKSANHEIEPDARKRTIKDRISDLQESFEEDLRKGSKAKDAVPEKASETAEVDVKSKVQQYEERVTKDTARKRSESVTKERPKISPITRSKSGNNLDMLQDFSIRDKKTLGQVKQTLKDANKPTNKENESPAERKDISPHKPGGGRGRG